MESPTSSVNRWQHQKSAAHITKSSGTHMSDHFSTKLQDGICERQNLIGKVIVYVEIIFQRPSSIPICATSPAMMS